MHAREQPPLRPFSHFPRWLAARLLAVVLGIATFSNLSLAQVPYNSFNGQRVMLHVWEGKYVAILTPTKDLDATEMAKTIAWADGAYEYYWRITGREPRKDRGYTLNGRATIAIVATPGWWGRGQMGHTGIELVPGCFDDFFKKGWHPSVLGYELGRNFWFYGDQLDYKEHDGATVDTAGVNVNTAFASYHQWLAQYSMGEQGIGRPGGGADRFIQTWHGTRDVMLDVYEASPELNWNNTIRIGRAPASNTYPNPLNVSLRTSDLLAAMLLRIHRNYGDANFPRKLWIAAAQRPAAKTTQDAVDNLIVACCQASQCDLTELFTKRWKTPMSARARAEVAGWYFRSPRLPPPTVPDRVRLLGPPGSKDYPSLEPVTGKPPSASPKPPTSEPPKTAPPVTFEEQFRAEAGASANVPTESSRTDESPPVPRATSEPAAPALVAPSQGNWHSLVLGVAVTGLIFAIGLVIQSRRRADAGTVRQDVSTRGDLG